MGRILLNGLLLGATVFLLVVGCGEESSNQQNNRQLSVYECLTSSSCDRILVVAHRGYTKYAPENSLASVRSAFELGVDFVEVDVRHTKDSVLVLMHDEDVDRTTDGHGKVEDFTFEQIQTLTLKGCDENLPGSCKVPTLQEVLELAKSLHRMIYLDIKTDRLELVVDLVQQGDFLETSLLHNRLNAAIELSELDSRLLILPLVKDVSELEYALSKIPNLKVVEYGGDVEPNPEFCNVAHELGLKVQQDVFFLKDVLAMTGDYSGWKNYIDAGVDIIQTDLPDVFLEALKEYNETGEFPSSGPGEEDL